MRSMLRGAGNLRQLETPTSRQPVRSPVLLYGNWIGPFHRWALPEWGRVFAIAKSDAKPCAWPGDSDVLPTFRH